MLQENTIVNGLWIGSKLSALEMLTIKSFLAHGHSFRLWLYEELENELPDGVQKMDANDIIPFERVFRYKNSNQYGHGKGSVSGFSDIFRYKLLFDHGGWWVDMDVTCLRPFQVEGPYYFRPHKELLLVGNVMKCPKGSELMQKCYEEANAEVDEDNLDWHKPIEILVENVKRLELEKFIVKDDSMWDDWNQIRKYLYTTKKLNATDLFVHWMNEEWRSKGLDKEDFMINSAFGQLLIRHDIVSSKFSGFDRIGNTVRFTFKRFFGQ